MPQNPLNTVETGVWKDKNNNERIISNYIGEEPYEPA
jgi:hypothetical protein